MEIKKTSYNYNNKDINSNSLNLSTNKLLTLIDDINIYNLIIKDLKKYNDLVILPDITYLEGIEETLEVENNITHIIINYEIFLKNNLNLHEILQLLLNIKKNKKYNNDVLDIIILLQEEDLNIKEKLQLININKIFIIKNINSNFLYNILKNNKITNLQNNVNEDILINNLMNFEKNILNIEHTKNNKNDKESSGFSKLLTSVSKYISCIFKQNKSEIIKLQNIYKFNDLKKEYTKKIKLSESSTKYIVSNNNSNNANNTNNSNIITTSQETYNNELINLSLSNLISKCKKIEIILSDKEDI